MLTMCTWTGDTVFDDVRTANYTVTPSDDGTPKTRFNFSTRSGIDECLNTQLIESALAFTREYDTYWGGVMRDPTTFDPEEAAEFKTTEAVQTNIEAVERLLRDNLHWEGLNLDANLPDSAANHILGRRYTHDDREFFEVLACRPMDERYGLYQGDLLIDDEKVADSEGYSIIKYQIRRFNDRWQLIGTNTNVWGDCIETQPNWLEGVNAWQPEPTAWQILIPRA